MSLAPAIVRVRYLRRGIVNALLFWPAAAMKRIEKLVVLLIISSSCHGEASNNRAWRAICRGNHQSRRGARGVRYVVYYSPINRKLELIKANGSDGGRKVGGERGKAIFLR